MLYSNKKKKLTRKIRNRFQMFVFIKVSSDIQVRLKKDRSYVFSNGKFVSNNIVWIFTGNEMHRYTINNFRTIFIYLSYLLKKKLRLKIMRVNLGRDSRRGENNISRNKIPCSYYYL